VRETKRTTKLGDGERGEKKGGKVANEDGQGGEGEKKEAGDLLPKKLNLMVEKNEASKGENELEAEGDAKGSTEKRT